jgi:hypothetical protein
MWQKDGQKRLYGAWLNDNLAYKLKASTDEDTGTANFWVPLPKDRGAYFMRSTLTVDGHAVASKDSEQFE